MCLHQRGGFKKIWKDEQESATQKSQNPLQVQKRYELRVKAKSEETFGDLEGFQCIWDTDGILKVQLAWGRE